MPHQVHRSGNSAAYRLASSQTDKVQYRNGQVITHTGLDEPVRKGMRHLLGKRDACQSHLIPLPSTTETIQSKLAPRAETTIASLPPGCGGTSWNFDPRLARETRFSSWLCTPT